MTLRKFNLYQVCLKCKAQLVGLHIFDNEGKPAKRIRDYCYECEKTTCKENKS